MTTRSALYRAARLLGDVEAARRGPVAYGKRRVRRKVYRLANRSLARAIRRMSL